MKKIILNSIAVLLIAIIPLSCKKGPGPGGKATITGKIYINNYSSNVDYTTLPPIITYTLVSSYYGQNESVYIIYGDEKGVGKFVKTAADGTYVFDFLRTGNYKVYALSRDLSDSLSTGKQIAVVKDVTISGRKDVITLDSLVINK